MTKYITYSGQSFVRVTKKDENILNVLNMGELQQKIVNVECEYNTMFDQIIQRIMLFKQKVFADVFQLKRAMQSMVENQKLWSRKVQPLNFDHQRLKVFLNGETSQKLKAIIEDLKNLTVNDSMLSSIKMSIQSKISMASTRPDLLTSSSSIIVSNSPQNPERVFIGSGKPLSQIKIIPRKPTNLFQSPNRT